MAIAPRPNRPPEGDYIVLRGQDTPEQRADAQQTLRNQGCKRFWHENLEDGRMRVHGYMRSE